MLLFNQLLYRDIVLILRARSDSIQPLLFFVITVSLFPLGIGAEPLLLQRIGPGIIWVAALLSTLLSLDGLFRSDHADGTLEQLLLSPHSDLRWILAKVVAHWLMTGCPLLLLSPLMGLFFNFDIAMIGALFISLLLGTPILSLVGAMGSAVTVTLHRGGILLALLVLPLYIPILIFGTTAVIAAGQGFPIIGHMALLGALMLLALLLAPMASAYALRLMVDA